MASNKKQENSDAQSNNMHKHMWIMAACCGLPLIGFLAIGALGASATSFEPLFSLICLVGMGYMMFSMFRDQRHGKGGSCHDKKQGDQPHYPKKQSDKNGETVLVGEVIPAHPPQGRQLTPPL
ncbi:MAG: hypothetical protein HQL69_17950 [Magnetococcales bacterium]|nr:hypothetical protein [Magnetococcales bacterium]